MFWCSILLVLFYFDEYHVHLVSLWAMRQDGITIYLCLVPAGRRAPGNQSGRGTEGGGQSLRGKAVWREIKRKWRFSERRCGWSMLVTST